MIDKPGTVEEQQDRLSLKRWSRRKLEVARAQAPPADVAAEPVATIQSAQALQPIVETPQPAAAPLPPIESLTIDSEFAAFFKPDVAEATKRAALKQLFRDPRFNIMDGLDVYIDDYTQPDPIPAEMMQQLVHTRHIFNPPVTEVNAEGHVVDKVVPAPETDAAAAAATGTARAPPAPRVADNSAPEPESDAAPLSGKAKHSGDASSA